MIRRETEDPTPRGFRDVMGRFATGVSVMTTAHDGTQHGMTANAVASVSLDPLLALVCVERDKAMRDLVEASGVFALCFLHEDDEGLAVHFADPYRPRGVEQFRAIQHHTAVTGAPILDDAIGYVDCRVHDLHPAGDHEIVVGRVLGLGLGDPAEPLLFFRGAYRTLRPEGT